jgi:hypothetical protein
MIARPLRKLEGFLYFSKFYNNCFSVKYKLMNSGQLSENNDIRNENPEGG